MITAVAGSAAAGTILSAYAGESIARPTSRQADKALLLTSQLETLRQICQLTIPTTDTPGAADVNCHHFIDHQLRVIFSTHAQQQVVALLNKISNAGYQYGKSEFEQLPATSQLRLLADLEQPGGEFSGADKRVFKLLKGLIVFGYYTSEPGATKELTYLSVPGGFKGSVPLSTVGSAYSSKAFY
ncbi:MAG: gluconate 2-dehydrogenase subunit 3 family protein [Alteromonadaceae bacterium]|nr:gluconate 2-dehydrogenase subunit 3 family protein [Alteromonadaceae bacterium]